ncbi:MAG: hypothetical protein H6536_07170 [Bacteroidales bacterium]|nr:hypothetical protein [Bacteroidales bacterium]
MPRVGLFVDSTIPDEVVNKAFGGSGCSCVGQWVQSLNHNSQALDLLIAQSDIAFIDVLPDFKFDVAAKAIRRGVTPILNSPEGLSHANLCQLQQLALEMGLAVNFNTLGACLGSMVLPLSTPFIARIERTVNQKIGSWDSFMALLVSDIATALKLSRLNIRKVRAYSIPVNVSVPSNLLVLIDFTDNSVATYSFQTLSAPEQLAVSITEGEGNQSFLIPSTEGGGALREGFPIELFLKKIPSRGIVPENIELAVRVSNVIDAVLSKIKH